MVYAFRLISESNGSALRDSTIYKMQLHPLTKNLPPDCDLHNVPILTLPPFNAFIAMLNPWKKDMMQMIKLRMMVFTELLNVCAIDASVLLPFFLGS